MAKFSEENLPNADCLQSANSSVVDSRERPALAGHDQGGGKRKLDELQGKPATDPTKEFSAREPFLLELFCGTAGVSAQFKRAGGKALGIDHHLNRNRLKSAAVKLDLTKPWVQTMVLEEVASGRVDGVHLGPPCGTSSRARNIPIKKKLKRQGVPSPKPLRSSRWPDGLPNLKGVNKERVAAANELYSFCRRVIEACERHNVLFTVENPTNSFMWETSFFRHLVDNHFFSDVDACEYGSEHKKSTGFLSNFFPNRLQLKCSGSHVHKPWTIKRSELGKWEFDTAKAAEYTIQMSQAIAMSFMDVFQCDPRFSFDDSVVNYAPKIASQLQPRRTRGPLLVAEFKHKVTIECFASDHPPKVISFDAVAPWQGVPIGSKLIDLQPIQSQKGECGRLAATYGVFFNEEEFISKVAELTHPFDMPMYLDESNLEAMTFILSHSPSEVAVYRSECIRYYIDRAKLLSQEEKALHDSMHSDLRPVMKSKRLLLFKEMLRDAGVSDEALFQDMVEGFKLIGDLNPSGQFQSKWKPASLSSDQLAQTAKWAQHAVVSSCKRVLEDNEIAVSVWEESIAQAALDKQWLKGPFTAAEISSRVGNDWIPARRFGVRQGGKIRPVDDFSQFLINSSVSCHEKIDLEGIDHICATARFFMGAVDESGACRFGGGGNSMLFCHRSWPADWNRSLKGRCLELKHAYKQLVRHPNDNWVSIIAVVNPLDSQVYFFEAIALPFGSVSSVIAFNRVARARRMILSRVFKLVVTNFFDDFCQIETELLATSSQQTAELVLDLLGWEISRGEDKRKPFASSFEILGAVISFEFEKVAFVRVSNKPSRVEQLVAVVDDLKKQLGRKVSRTIIESLKGRLLYAAGHTHGRCTQLACQLLHKFSGDGPFVILTAELIHAVVMALDQLTNAKPREIMPWSQQRTVLLFTDGAVEDDFGCVTYGALLVDMAVGKRFYFGGHIPDSLVNDWRSKGKKHVIAQAEIYPILVSKETWADLIYQRSVLWFTDNESARMALIRNYSPVIDNFLLLQVNSQLDLRVEARHWYSRVPSKSNPSDAASRLSFEAYSDACWSEPVFQLCLDCIVQLSELKRLLERGGK